MLILSLIHSSLLLAVTNAVYWSGNGRGAWKAILALGVGVVFPCGCVYLPTAALNSLLSIGLVIGFSFFRVDRARFLAASVLLTVGLYVFVCVWTWADIKAALDRFPMQSLSARLAPLSGTRDVSTGANLESLREMEEQANWFRNGSRRWERSRPDSLRDLHEKTVEEFINSPGFGITRGFRSSTTFSVRPIESIRLAGAADFGVPPESRQPWLSGADSSRRNALEHRQWLTRLHRSGLFDFFDTSDFGYVRDRDHVAGFVPHHFTTLPGPGDYTIHRLELVSLLKHPEPMVYESEELPRMDRVEEYPVRELDGFEREALAGLKKGSDLEYDAATRRIEMLGSIRALEPCLACHAVERGALLGAFSYKLRR